MERKYPKAGAIGAGINVLYNSGFAMIGNLPVDGSSIAIKQFVNAVALMICGEKEFFGGSRIDLYAGIWDNFIFRWDFRKIVIAVGSRPTIYVPDRKAEVTYHII